MVAVRHIEKIPEDGDFTEIIEELKEKLSGTETLRLIAWVPVDKKRGHNYTVLTGHRLLFVRRGNFRMVGESEIFKDYPFHSIDEINVEERRGYDLLVLNLKSGSSKKLMIPEGSGPRITSVLRTLESEKKKMEEQGETATQKLEKLSELYDKGKLTKKEFKEKKERLLEEI